MFSSSKDCIRLLVLTLAQRVATVVPRGCASNQYPLRIGAPPATNPESISIRSASLLPCTDLSLKPEKMPLQPQQAFETRGVPFGFLLKPCTKRGQAHSKTDNPMVNSHRNQPNKPPYKTPPKRLNPPTPTPSPTTAGPKERRGAWQPIRKLSTSKQLSTSKGV